jgi:hypothetical protein
MVWRTETVASPGTAAAHLAQAASSQIPVPGQLGAAIFFFAMSVYSIVGPAEAAQMLFNASGIFHGLAHAAMFAIPVIGLRSVTGLVTTLLGIVLSILPVIRSPV